MGNSATRLPPLSVQKGACSWSRSKPLTRKWRSSRTRYRTPASAKSAARSGSHTRSVSHSPVAGTPKRRWIASRIHPTCSTRSAGGGDAGTGPSEPATRRTRRPRAATRPRTRQRDSTRGRAQHDHRLDPGDGVEEPAARGKHAERLALELRGQSSTLALEHGVQLSREPVEGRTQRRAPALLRGALRRGATAALGAPALHPVGTAPRAWCDEPHFLLGLVPGQERR